MAGEFRSGKGDAPGAPSDKARQLKTAPFGLRDNSRLWARHLQRSLTGEVGVRILVADRSGFKWEWNGVTLLAACHAGGVLFCPSGSGIRTEFLRRVRVRFKITDKEELVSLFCGYQFGFCGRAHTTKIHQGDFARVVLVK